MKTSVALQKFTLTAMFVAIIFVLTFTPVGFVQLGVIKATIIHVPVILGAVLLGPRSGAILGFTFGVASIISNTMAPTLLSFCFSPAIPVPGTDRGSVLALLICFVPRILVGVVPYYVYQLMRRLEKVLKRGWRYLGLAAAGLAGSLTNTLLVMHLIFFLFKDAYAEAKGISPQVVYRAVLAVIGTNGVPEALVAMVIVAAVGRVLLKLAGDRFERKPSQE